MTGDIVSQPTKLACPADKCGHQLISQKNLATHMRKFYEGLLAVSNIFSSPRAGTSSASPAQSSPNPNATPKQIEFATEGGTDLHTEEELLREAAEEQAIFEALENLAESEFDPDTAEEIKEKTKDKLNRYRAIMTKKTELQTKTELKVKELDEQVARLKNDAVLRDEVVDNKEISLDKKR